MCVYIYLINKCGFRFLLVVVYSSFLTLFFQLQTVSYIFGDLCDKRITKLWTKIYSITNKHGQGEPQYTIVMSNEVKLAELGVRMYH